jgi:hypothetical protein
LSSEIAVLPLNDSFSDANGAFVAAPGTGVRVRALPANRQIQPVPDTPVAANFTQPADIERHLAAKLALNLVFPIDNFANAAQFVFRQITDSNCAVHPRAVQNLNAGRLANPKYTLQGYDDRLLDRNVDT